MRTLEDAWAWYQAVATGLRHSAHLAKFWGTLPWGQDVEWVNRLARDNVLRAVEPAELERSAVVGGRELDDLAVLVLFSVFEANVRDLVESQVRSEIDGMKHPTLVAAGRDALAAILEGSFFQVLAPFKSAVGQDLVERVNQVRKYRNWVAHGRRPDRQPSADVDPKSAYDRLREFLKAVRGSSGVTR